MNRLSVPHSDLSSDQSRERAKGMISFAACAMLWSTAGIFIKILPWNAPLIAGVRSLIAGIFLLAWIGKPRFHWSFAQVAAAVLNTATMCLFVYANKTTTSANAILLQYSAPVITAVAGALILRERPRAEEVIAFLFVMIGMGIFFFESLGVGRLLGNLAAATTGLTFGLYFVFMRMQKDGSPLESNLLSQWLTALVMLPIAAFLPMPAVTTGSVLAILALGVLQIGLAAVFFAYGIKRVTAVQGVLVALIEPFFNPFWVFLFMGERPSSAAMVGGFMIVAAVTAASVIGARRAARAVT